MKQFVIHSILICSLMVAATSCIYEFNADIDPFENSFLVVEGNILAGEESVFTFSTSASLNELDEATKSGAPTSAPNDNYIASNAVSVTDIRVECSDGSSISGSGNPAKISTKNIDVTKEYRLTFTSQGKHYASSWVPVTTTTEIDSLDYTFDKDTTTHVTFRVSTHAPEDTRYFLWTVYEDWEVTPMYYTALDYDPILNQIIDRPYDKNIYYCWQNRNLPEAFIADTKRLTSSLIVDRDMHSILFTDPRISNTYCATVYQMTLTPEAYAFWEVVRRNSEEMGGLFSPQPGEMSGNIVCLEDESQQVLGFVSAGQRTYKRVFFDNRDYRVFHSLDNRPCVQLALTPWQFPAYNNRHYLPYMHIEDTENYYWITQQCGDCRLKGTKTRPSYWINEHI